MTKVSEPSASRNFAPKSRKSVLESLRQFIRENRRAPPLKFAGRAAEKYLRAYYNEDFWEFPFNGEMFAATVFKAWLNDRSAVIWDVGANAGQWTLEIMNILTISEFHCFEIIPSTYIELNNNVDGIKNIHTHCIGLSDNPGNITVQLNPINTLTSSISPRLGDALFPKDTVPTECKVSTVDLLRREIAPPEFLKLDVEGHEVSVLRGAQELLNGPNRPSMIQIEYGNTYIPSGSTLKNVYDLLIPHGYNVGRLYPNYVDFKSYAYEDDTFRLGNLIATDNAILTKMLS